MSGTQDDQAAAKEAARLKRNAQRRAQRAANPEKAAADRARWREMDKLVPGRLEERRAKDAQYRRGRAEVDAAKRAAYNAANSSRIVAKVNQWRKDNPGRHAVQQHNQRAKALNIEGKLSTDIVDLRIQEQGGACPCCGAALADGYEVDHIIPLCRGGLNLDSNIQILAAKCNMSKGTKTMDEFLAWKAAKNGVA